MPTKEAVLDAMKDVYDPEIPFNIVDLGLVYSVDVDESKVEITMTLTSPGCGMGPYIANNVREKVLELEGVQEVNVDVVFEPQWTPERISDEIKAEMGIDD